MTYYGDQQRREIERRARAWVQTIRVMFWAAVVCVLVYIAWRVS